MFNWDAIGAIGEIVGALAVVITIIYLSKQIRDSSKQVKLNTTQSYAALVQDAYAPVYTNSETLRAWIVGNESPDELADHELKLYFHLMDRQFNNAVPLLNHYQEGAMSPEEFAHYLAFFDGLASSPGGKRWKEQRQDAFRIVFEHLGTGP